MRQSRSDPVSEALAFEAALIGFLADQLTFFPETTLDMATLFDLYSGLGKYGGKRRLPEALDALCADLNWRWEDSGYGTFTFYAKSYETGPNPTHLTGHPRR